MGSSYLGLRWVYDARRAEIPPETTVVALRLAETISRLVRTALFTSPDHTPASFDWITRRSLGGVPLIQCTYPAHDASGQRRLSTVWVADARSVRRVADPEQFGATCIAELGRVLHGTEFHDDRFFTTGQRFLTQRQAVGYAARAAAGVRVPDSDNDVAFAMANVANTLAWEVTGGSNRLPAIDFLFDRDQKRGAL